MTDVRLEVPEFIAENCTGCAQCWTQCPDSAIPGLVTEVDQLIEIGIATAANGRPLERIRQVSKHLAKEMRERLEAGPFTSFVDTLDTAFAAVGAKLGWEGEKRASSTTTTRVFARRSPISRSRKTGAVLRRPRSRKQAGTGGLLSITVNPEACKGCNLCVAVCPDGALVTVKQDPHDRRHAAPQLGVLEEAARHARPIRQRPRHRRRHRRAVVAAAQEGQLSLDGRRRRRVHGLRREDRGAPRSSRRFTR